MKPFEAALLEALRAHKGRFTAGIVADSENAPAQEGQVKYPPEAIEQFVNGFFLFIEEALEKGTSEAREFYMSTAIPAIRASGIPAKGMVGGSAKTMIRITATLTRHVAEEHKDEAERWLADFFGDYIGDMASLWEGPRV